MGYTRLSSRTDRPEWQARIEERWEQVKPQAFRLTREVVPGVHQVRTRGSRAYLLVEDEGVTLVDAGNPGSGLRVLEALKEIDRSADDIKHIVITHCHLDHVGGLPEIQRHVSARTAVHLAEAPTLESDEPLPNPFQHPLMAKLLERWLLRQDPGSARVDLHLDDGDTLPVLGGLQIVHAPGHTAGSISLYLPARGLLMVGDAMQYKFGRLMAPSRLFTEDMLEATASIRKLAALDFETLCFSHFRPIVEGAGQQVREFARILPAQRATQPPVTPG